MKDTRLIALIEAKQMKALKAAAKRKQVSLGEVKSLNLDLVFPLPEPEVGSTVTVQMYDGRTIQGVVKAIQNTTTGKKFRVVSGDITIKVNSEQILEA